MKKLLVTTAVTVAMASSAFAGGYQEPVLEGEVFVDEGDSSSASMGSLGNGAVIGGVLALALIAALASDDDSDDD
ncbi:hypothetical protein [Vannielia sp.]|uniref:hypothetical protein n=1 Tax=Vannielia sp. TaxID=2813045 RepID=UPI00262BF3C6|nr:hypothetical protein [Vannielia sp.]MDF1872316.1 hypothetical protein [Vannielia sp.]